MFQNDYHKHYDDFALVYSCASNTPSLEYAIPSYPRGCCHAHQTYHEFRDSQIPYWAPYFWPGIFIHGFLRRRLCPYNPFTGLRFCMRTRRCEDKWAINIAQFCNGSDLSRTMYQHIWWFFVNTCHRFRLTDDLLWMACVIYYAWCNVYVFFGFVAHATVFGVVLI